MKTLTAIAMSLLMFASGFCFARPPECDPGPHGCDNKSFAPPVVQIHPFKVGDKNGMFFILVDKKGEITEYEKTEGFKYVRTALGTISQDGRVVDTSGRLLAVLRATSILEDSAGAPMVSIDSKGTLENGSGVPIRWTKDGTLKQGDVLLDFKLWPANSPARQAASIVLFLASSFQSPTIEQIPQALNKSMSPVNSAKSHGVTEEVADIPTPLSVCTDRASQRHSACISNGVFTHDTCQVLYQQAIDICYKKYN
ncbi:hypothetical protein V6L78_17865 [Pseudomonas canadensis]|uniref:hypothetical protein n=1 Tax=Pseudomonas canadensis TaxID=915099 RepID=UPI0030D47AB5